MVEQQTVSMQASEEATPPPRKKSTLDILLGDIDDIESNQASWRSPSTLLINQLLGTLNHLPGGN